MVVGDLVFGWCGVEGYLVDFVEVDFDLGVYVVVGGFEYGFVCLFFVGVVFYDDMGGDVDLFGE